MDALTLWQIVTVCICCTCVRSSGVIRIEPEFAVVEEGDSITFNCTVEEKSTKGDSRYLIIFQYANIHACSFSQNGDILRNETGYSCGRLSDDNYYLTIDHVKGTHNADDIGCQIGQSQATRRAKLDVQYPPVATVPRQSFTVNQSSDLFIPCTADANPVVTSIVWTKKGDSSQLRQSSGSLQLMDVDKSVTGTYICTATRTLEICNVTRQNLTVCSTGKNETSVAMVEVKVQYAPVITSFKIVGIENQSPIVVRESQSVRISCLTDSEPGSDIAISMNGRIVIQGEGRSVQHVLGRVGCHDRGNYTCSAKNILGEVESETIELLVGCSPRLVNTGSNELHFTVVFDGNATFTLTVIANPRPTFALMDSSTGTHLDSDTNPAWDGILATGTVTLYNIRVKDLLKCYVVSVNNTEGTRDFMIPFRDECPPGDPNDTRLNSTTSMVIGVGIGVAAMLVIGFFILITIVIRRKKVVSDHKMRPIAESFSAVTGDKAPPSESIIGDDGYLMPMNNYAGLTETPVAGPKSYEELRVYHTCN